MKTKNPKKELEEVLETITKDIKVVKKEVVVPVVPTLDPDLPESKQRHLR